MSKKPLNLEEWAMLDYFWGEKGDPTRYVGWQKILEEYRGVKKVKKAYKKYLEAERNVSRIIEELHP